MLTNDDFKTIMAIIDLGAKNGLFTPADFAMISQLYNKLYIEIQNNNNKKE